MAVGGGQHLRVNGPEADMDEAASFDRCGAVACGEAGRGGDPLLAPTHDAVVIRSAREMGMLLWAASPRQSRCFALDSHERACERADEGAMAFWREILECLSCWDSAAGDVVADVAA